MEYTIAFGAPAETVYREFTSADYWRALVAEYRRHDPKSELSRFDSGAHGTEVVLVQHIARRELPPVARQVLPADLVITRTQRFEPFDPRAGTAQGSYAATVPHAPGRLGGRYHLGTAADGSRLRVTNECKVHVPLLGGKLEELVLRALRDLFAAEEAFTAEWIRGR